MGSPLFVERDSFVSTTFSRDGSHLVAISTGVRGMRLATDPDVWKHHACMVAGRRLNQQEWRDALPGRPHQAIC